MFEEILIKELTNFSCCSFVHLFMPDHAHFILGGNDSNSEVKKCLNMFKQKTGFYIAKNLKDIRWQKDYYDHILRSEENLETHIKYILNNPVRAGLSEYWKKYPFKGSTVYNLEDWD